MKLFNTLSRRKEDIKPLKDGEISLYTCGLTVYSQPHIGNWVSYVYWDILQRALEENGLTVIRVQNITDVGHLVSDDDDGEDKMEKGARAEGITAWEVAEKYCKIADYEAYVLLGLRKPTKLVRATECIDEQISFVEELERKGFTYKIPREGIYFDTSKLTDYGKLARLDINGLQEGARVQIDGKRNRTDFALWKFSPKDAQRDMEWDSPWGKGFPGWHLECSVIARENLGDQIDIHTGGIDHIPVHHTNEIAQTESVTEKPFANVWLHNNHIKIDGGKMAKSKGNIYTLQDIQSKGYAIDAYKLMLLSKHYRTEGNFTWEILDAAQNRLQNWINHAAKMWQFPSTLTDTRLTKQFNKDLLAALSDDLDTPKAVALIDRYFEHCERPGEEAIECINKLLGLDITVPKLLDSERTLFELRSTARIQKDWPASDHLRQVLEYHNILVNDTPTGQTWSRKVPSKRFITKSIYAIPPSFCQGGITISSLPISIDIDGHTLDLKTEFHITLLAINHIASLIDKDRQLIIEKELFDYGCTFFKNNALGSISLIDEIRLVTDDSGAKTIIVLAHVPGLDELFNQLSDIYKCDIPKQPTHITLYVQNYHKGIPLNSTDELLMLSKKIKLSNVNPKIIS